MSAVAVAECGPRGTGLSQSSGAIIVGGDGTFRSLPAKRALTNGDCTPSRAEKFRVTTVFAGDGRYVHLRKPVDVKEPAMPSRQAPSQSSEDAKAKTVSKAEGRQLASGGVWTVQAGGCIEVRVPQAAQAVHALPALPATDVVKPTESWLDSRLKKGQAQPTLDWNRRIVQSRGGLGKEDPEENAASASLEVKISKRSPSSFRESSASLQIKAPSAQTLDRIILNSVDGLVAEMRPALC